MDDLAFAPLCVEMDGPQVKRVLCLGKDLPNVQRLHRTWANHRHFVCSVDGNPSKIQITNRSGPVAVVVGNTNHSRVVVSTTSEHPLDESGRNIVTEIQKKWRPNKPFKLVLPTDFKAWVNVTIVIPTAPKEGISLRTFSGTAKVCDAMQTSLSLYTYCGRVFVTGAIACRVTTEMRGGTALLRRLSECEVGIRAEHGLVIGEHLYGQGTTQIHTSTADVRLMKCTIPLRVFCEKGDVILKQCTFPLLAENILQAPYVEVDETNLRVVPNKLSFFGKRCLVYPTTTTPTIVDVSSATKRLMP